MFLQLVKKLEKVGTPQTFEVQPYFSENKKTDHSRYRKSLWRFNPQAPVAQKVADEVVFRRFRGEGVEFFSIGPH